MTEQNPITAAQTSSTFSASVIDPDYIKRLLAEHEAAIKELAEFRERERIEKENYALRERFRKELRAISTRNTLVLRRTPNHDKIAPSRDVLDYLDFYDLKEIETPEGKKTRVSDAELKVYQELKSNGTKDITPKMVKDIIEGKGGKVDDSDDADQEGSIG